MALEKHICCNVALEKNMYVATLHGLLSFVPACQSAFAVSSQQAVRPAIMSYLHSHFHSYIINISETFLGITFPDMAGIQGETRAGLLPEAPAQQKPDKQAAKL